MRLIYEEVPIEAINKIDIQTLCNINFKIKHVSESNSNDLYNISHLILHDTILQMIISLYLLKRCNDQFFLTIPVVPYIKMEDIKKERLYYNLIAMFDKCSVHYTETRILRISFAMIKREVEDIYMKHYIEGKIAPILNILSRNLIESHSYLNSYKEKIQRVIIYKISDIEKLNKNYDFNIKPILDYCDYLHKCKFAQFDLFFAGWKIEEISNNDIICFLIKQLINKYGYIYLLCSVTQDNRIMTEKIFINK